MLSGLRSALERFHQPWFVAGGQALDLFAGKQLRSHADLDVGLFRQDQLELRNALSGWLFEKIEIQTSCAWPPGEYLQLPIHELHASCGSKRLEFLLNERIADSWAFRRNLTITLPLVRAVLGTSESVPYLAPEIVLLYKAKDPRSVDEADFARVAPLLAKSAVEWLLASLAVCHPGHPWQRQLELLHVV